MSKKGLKEIIKELRNAIQEENLSAYISALRAAIDYISSVDGGSIEIGKAILYTCCNEYLRIEKDLVTVTFARTTVTIEEQYNSEVLNEQIHGIYAILNVGDRITPTCGTSISASTLKNFVVKLLSHILYNL